MLVSVFNKQTGAIEWVNREVDGCESLVGSSQHLDMVNDVSRNHAYDRALQHHLAALAAAAAATNNASSHEPWIHVLDIGTGTGLLAMFAARSTHVSTVVACELFVPMAELARRIIAANSLSHKIHLASKRSNDLTVAISSSSSPTMTRNLQDIAPSMVQTARERRLAAVRLRQRMSLDHQAHDLELDEHHYDMSQRAHLLVSEIFDTELLGEGVLPSIRDAIARLLRSPSNELAPDGSLRSRSFVVVPSAARVFAQLLGSKNSLLRSWVEVDQGRSRCSAATTPVVPVHVRGLLAAGTMHTLSEPLLVASFDFHDPPPEGSHLASSLTVHAATHGEVEAVLFWWEADLAPGVRISTSPHGAVADKPDDTSGSSYQWRDHWKQAVYLLPARVSVEDPNQPLTLSTFHSDYELWFSLRARNDNDDDDADADDIDRPLECSCAMHGLCNFERLWMLNDPNANALFARVAARIVSALSSKHQSLDPQPPIRILDLADGSRMALALAHDLQAKHLQQQWHIDALESSLSSKQMVALVAQQRDQQDLVTTSLGSLKAHLDRRREDDIARGATSSYDAIIAEPFAYLNAFQLPERLWEARRLLDLESRSSADTKWMGDQTLFVPARCTLMVAVASFAHLHKSFEPAQPFSEVSCGIDVTLLNPLYQQPVNRQGFYSLWMYEYELLSPAVGLPALSIDFQRGTITTTNNAADNHVADLSSMQYSSSISLPIVRSGTANAFVFWWRYQMLEGHEADEHELVVDAIPSDANDPSYWRHCVQFLAQPLDLDAAHTATTTPTLDCRVEYCMQADHPSSVIIKDYSISSVSSSR